MALYYRKKLAKGGYGLPLIFVLVVLWGTIVFMVVRNVEAPADEPLVPVLPPPQGPVMTDGERRAPAPTQDSPVMPKDATNVSPPSVEIIVENTEDSRAAAVATPPTILETGTLKAKVEDVEDSVPKLIPLSILNDRVRPAVVNILCTTNTGGVLFPISGSGVIIDPRGIILTNAHVAQYYLLTSYRKSGFIDCTIRTGSPAKNAYKAELLYLSPPWVAKNAKNLIATDPVATGEDDFALLYITGSTKGAGPLPVSFPFVAPAVNDSDIKIGTGALAASYPAGFLGGSAIRNDLYQSSAPVVVMDLLTFPTTANSLDILSIGGSIVAQKGSSGGAVVSQNDGTLIGIIVTTSIEDTTGERDLGALTLTHINNSLVRDIGVGLASLLADAPAIQVQQFSGLTAPALTKALEDVLDTQR